MEAGAAKLHYYGDSSGGKDDGNVDSDDDKDDDMYDNKDDGNKYYVPCIPAADAEVMADAAAARMDEEEEVDEGAPAPMRISPIVN
jgi:hypothetical protein